MPSAPLANSVTYLMNEHVPRGGGAEPCKLRSNVNKFEHVWGWGWVIEGPCMVGVLYGEGARLGTCMGTLLP